MSTILAESNSLLGSLMSSQASIGFPQVPERSLRFLSSSFLNDPPIVQSLLPSLRQIYFHPPKSKPQQVYRITWGVSFFLP